MPKNVLKIFVGFFSLLFLTGCGVQAKNYVQVRERVDQDIKGNAGFLMGTPSAKDIDRSQIRKTRKVYVLEMSKSDDEEDMTKKSAPAPAPESSLPPEDTSAPAPANHGIVLPNFDAETPAAQAAPTGPTSASEYTIMKDDTLQKISKKFYDTYGKWQKIYEANKDKISNPNRLKTGVTITIPPVQ